MLISLDLILQEVYGLAWKDELFIQEKSEFSSLEKSEWMSRDKYSWGHVICHFLFLHPWQMIINHGTFFQLYWAWFWQPHQMNIGFDAENTW